MELKGLAIPERNLGHPIDPDLDLEVTATWGFRGQKNAVMCGKGKVTDNATHDDAVDLWINDRVC